MDYNQNTRDYATLERLSSLPHRIYIDCNISMNNISPKIIFMRLLALDPINLFNELAIYK